MFIVVDPRILKILLFTRLDYLCHPAAVVVVITINDIYIAFSGAMEAVNQEI